MKDKNFASADDLVQGEAPTALRCHGVWGADHFAMYKHLEEVLVELVPKEMLVEGRRAAQKYTISV